MADSKGEWKVYTDNMVGAMDIVAEDGMGFFTETVAHIRRANPNYEANAHLMVAAVNACKKLNPDNPQAVAESIGDMYEALKTCLATLDANRAYILASSTIAEAQQALAKADGK